MLFQAENKCTFKIIIKYYNNNIIIINIIITEKYYYFWQIIYNVSLNFEQTYNKFVTCNICIYFLQKYNNLAELSKHFEQAAWLNLYRHRVNPLLKNRARIRI